MLWESSLLIRYIYFNKPPKSYEKYKHFDMYCIVLVYLLFIEACGEDIVLSKTDAL